MVLKGGGTRREDVGTRQKAPNHMYLRSLLVLTYLDSVGSTLHSKNKQKSRESYAKDENYSLQQDARVGKPCSPPPHTHTENVFFKRRIQAHRSPDGSHNRPTSEENISASSNCPAGMASTTATKARPTSFWQEPLYE